MLREGQPKSRLESLRAQVAYAERLKYVTNRIHAAKDLDQLFAELHDEILGLFDAERLALYAVDYDKKEVYSRFSDLDTIREIRVPLNDQSTLVSFALFLCFESHMGLDVVVEDVGKSHTMPTVFRRWKVKTALISPSAVLS